MVLCSFLGRVTKLNRLKGWKLLNKFMESTQVKRAAAHMFQPVFHPPVQEKCSAMMRIRMKILPIPAVHAAFFILESLQTWHVVW